MTVSHITFAQSYGGTRNSPAEIAGNETCTALSYFAASKVFMTAASISLSLTTVVWCSLCGPTA